MEDATHGEESCTVFFGVFSWVFGGWCDAGFDLGTEVGGSEMDRASRWNPQVRRTQESRGSNVWSYHDSSSGFLQVERTRGPNQS